MLKAFVIILIFASGCGVTKHSGQIDISNPNHIKVTLNRPMLIEVEANGVKVKADSRENRAGLMEDLFKLMAIEGFRN